MFLTLILISIFGITFSQKSMEYGFLGGVNVNSTVGENFFNKENLGVYVGKSFGGFFKINLSKQLGLKGMLQYDQNGFAFKGLTFEDVNGAAYPNTSNVILRNTYLNMPILAEYSFGKKLKINLNAGPFVGILLSSNLIFEKAKGYLNGVQIPRKQKSENYQSLNYGIALGANFSMSVTKKVNLQFGVNNNFGLAKIFKSGYLESKGKQNALSVLAGLSFRLL